MQRRERGQCLLETRDGCRVIAGTALGLTRKPIGEKSAVRPSRGVRPLAGRGRSYHPPSLDNRLAMRASLTAGGGPVDVDDRRLADLKIASKALQPDIDHTNLGLKQLVRFHHRVSCSLGAARQRGRRVRLGNWVVRNVIAHKAGNQPSEVSSFDTQSNARRLMTTVGQRPALTDLTRGR